MSSSTSNSDSPNWKFLKTKTGVSSLIEAVLILIVALCLGNLSRTYFGLPDRDLIFTYLSMSALHLGYISYFVFVTLVEGVFPNVQLDYYRNYDTLNVIVEVITHLVSWNVFLKLTNSYGWFSEMYVTYVIRTILRSFIWTFGNFPVQRPRRVNPGRRRRLS